MPDLHPLIPPADVVRERLSRAVRETELLRSLLPLAVRAERERAHGGIATQDGPEQRREAVA